MALGRQHPAPGEIIASDWGARLWDQSVQTFTNTTDRDTQYASPRDGAITYQEDSDTFTARVNGAWRPLGTPMAAGSLSLGSVPAASSVSAAVTFPVGRFTAIPAVVISAYSTTPHARNAAVASITAAGFNAWFGNWGTGSVTGQAGWFAIPEGI